MTNNNSLNCYHYTGRINMVGWRLSQLEMSNEFIDQQEKVKISETWLSKFYSQPLKIG